MKVIDYITGLLPFPIDDTIIDSILIKRGISNIELSSISDGGVVTPNFSALGNRNADLILADIYVLFANGSYSFSQRVGTGDLTRQIVVNSLTEKEKQSMRYKANCLYKKWGEIDSIEKPKNAINI